MNRRTLKIVRQLLALTISLWILSGVQTGYAQQIKWLRISELQAPINEIGSEYESEFTQGNTNFFSWPAQYGIDQNTTRMKGLWIGCKNFDDPVEKKIKSVKVIGSGPRDDTDRVNKIFEQEIKLVGRYTRPSVTVNGQSATVLETYDILDSVDVNLPCDRMVLVRFNTSIGISVTKKVMAFGNSEHGNYLINDYVFKNTGIIDRAGTVKLQTLDSVWFYFMFRHAFAGVTSSGFGSTWGAFESLWGETTLNHSFGENPAAPDFEMRGFYAYYGPSNRRPDLYEEDWGCPNLSENGVLGSAKYAGSVTLHADKSPQDKIDDFTQPKTTWFISPDITIMQANGSQYDEVFMADRYTAMSEGHPTKPHDEVVGNQYPISYTDPRRQIGGGTGQGQGYGPYTVAPGDSIHIVFAEGVSGLSWEKCREVGANWLPWYNKTAAPPLIMPDGSTTTDYNLYKRRWVETGKDSILKTYRNAIKNYNSVYNIPKPPPPPTLLTVTSGGDRIKLAWSDNADSSPHFDGYVIYRSQGNVLDWRTVYQNIFECNKSNVTHSLDDVTAVAGIEYYYYVQSKDDGTLNDVEPGKPLCSSMFWTATAAPVKTVTSVNEPSSSKTPTAFLLEANYPNPFNPSTTISFGLPSRSFVSLKVFNVIGREVATLVNEVRNPGTYSVTWDASSMPSGVYFYRMKAGNFVDTNKMALLK